MQVSKTRIKMHLKRKTHSDRISTIVEAKKHPAWLPVAKMLASSTRNYTSANIGEIDEKFAVGDVVVVVGRVLSLGHATKKLKICSLGISSLAAKKIKDAKSEYSSIVEEIKKNPSAKGVKIYGK